MTFAASTLLEQLAACLCAQITEAHADSPDYPDVCFCGVVPGDAASMDYMGCEDKNGMAWVRGGSLYPATGLNVISEAVNNDGASIGMDIEIGMGRYIPLGEGLDLPTVEAYRDAGRLQMDDALVMLKAIRCCFSENLDNDVVVGTYDPFGPLGGIAGGSWPLAVLLD